MPPRLTRPTNVIKSRQPFVDMLWRFYIAAGRPPTRKVAATIEEWEERNGSANHETIRRTLRGETVGVWLTAEVIFLALCEMADVDPHDVEIDDDYDGRFSPPPVSHLEQFRRYWNEAVDGMPMPTIPRTRKERDEQQMEAERAELEARASRVRSLTDEPPF